jgi:hypothetical protein
VTIVAVLPRIASAGVVFFGRSGEVTQQAQQRGLSRQALYRQANAVVQAARGDRTPGDLAALRQHVQLLQARLAGRQRQQRWAVVIDPDKQAAFAATAQAAGVSLSVAWGLLRLLLGTQPPSRAERGRQTRAAGPRAGQVLAVLDEFSRPRAHQVAAAELCSGRRPVLVTRGQDSLCWVGGRLAPSRDGAEWAQEFRQRSAAEQITAAGGQGIRSGLERVNHERRPAGGPEVAGQRDHFRALQRARRAGREARPRAVRAVRPAEQAQQASDQAGRQGVPRSPMQGRLLHQAWAKAERAFDGWSAAAGAFGRRRSGLRRFTPAGELSARARAAAAVPQALAGQTGPEWARARRLLGPEAFPFLGRAQQQLAALPVAAELRQAAVRGEGLRRRPEALRGEGSAARALRGGLLAAGLVLALSGEAGSQALAWVRGVRNGAWRASSLGGGLNSVLRMPQARPKRLTPELLDLKRLYGNVHEFRAGKRKGTSPYGRLGLVLPQGGWWGLLKLPPEQLRQQLSALNPAA